MNFCPNCGGKCAVNANFCANCGASLKGTGANNNFINNQQQGMFGGSSMNNLLGTLVTVNLVNGLTKNLYMRDGNYYTDAQCRHPFTNTAMIMGISGRSADEISDVMSLSGQKVDMESVHRNQMAKQFMRGPRIGRK